MKRVRYMPPGSMRRQRRIGRLEGSVGMLALVCAIGAGLLEAHDAATERAIAASAATHVADATP